jgi:N-acetylglucosamine malate deacetylase 1
MTTGEAFHIAGICAHPDDAELVMGGTVALEAARGRRVALVDLTRGECGSRGTPETRAQEAQDAAGVLGVRHRESLGLPDARLAHVPEHKDPLVEAVRRLRPELVILPYWEQRHPDHAMASRIGYDACFLAGLKNYRPDLGPAFRPRKIVYALSMTEASETAPSFVVDITSVWDVKMRAVRAFASQFTPGPGETVTLPFERFQLAVEANARRHGERIGVQYGEGFLVREPMKVDDLLSLEGRSV